MRIYQDKLDVPTILRPLNVTDRVRAVVKSSGVDIGLCTVFVQHTSAGLVIQENADPAVLRDLEEWLSRMAPESHTWNTMTRVPMTCRRTCDPSHTDLRAIPVRGGESRPWDLASALPLGTSPTAHHRNLIVHVRASPERTWGRAVSGSPRAATCFLALAAIVGSARPLHAYCRTTVCGQDCELDPITSCPRAPRRWPQFCVSYSMQTRHRPRSIWTPRWPPPRRRSRSGRTWMSDRWPAVDPDQR